MKKLLKFTFNVIFVFCVSYLTCAGAFAATDSIIVDDPIITDGLGVLDFSGNVILDNWGIWLTILSIFFTIILRVVPTARNWDWLSLLTQILDLFVPNKATTTSGEKSRFKYRKLDKIKKEENGHSGRIK